MIEYEEDLINITDKSDLVLGNHYLSRGSGIVYELIYISTNIDNTTEYRFKAINIENRRNNTHISLGTEIYMLLKSLIRDKWQHILT